MIRRQVHVYFETDTRLGAENFGRSYNGRTHSQTRERASSANCATQWVREEDCQHWGSKIPGCNERWIVWHYLQMLSATDRQADGGLRQGYTKEREPFGFGLFWPFTDLVEQHWKRQVACGSCQYGIRCKTSLASRHNPFPVGCNNFSWKLTN